MIHIDNEPWRQMVEHARATYPNECCGAMLGSLDDSGKQVRIALRLDNARRQQSRHEHAHKSNPHTPPKERSADKVRSGMRLFNRELSS